MKEVIEITHVSQPVLVIDRSIFMWRPQLCGAQPFSCNYPDDKRELLLY